MVTYVMLVLKFCSSLVNGVFSNLQNCDLADSEAEQPTWSSFPNIPNKKDIIDAYSKRFLTKNYKRRGKLVSISTVLASLN